MKCRHRKPDYNRFPPPPPKKMQEFLSPYVDSRDQGGGVEFILGSVSARRFDVPPGLRLEQLVQWMIEQEGDIRIVDGSLRFDRVGGVDTVSGEWTLKFDGEEGFRLLTVVLHNKRGE